MVLIIKMFFKVLKSRKFGVYAYLSFVISWSKVDVDGLDVQLISDIKVIPFNLSAIFLLVFYIISYA